MRILPFETRPLDAFYLVEHVEHVEHTEHTEHTRRFSIMGGACELNAGQLLNRLAHHC